MQQHDATEEAVRSLRSLILAGERYRQVMSNYVGLGVTEAQAVSYLTVHGDQGQNELAAGLGLSSGASTALVDRLERQGIAERYPHPSDRRRTLVRLTDRNGYLRGTDADFRVKHAVITCERVRCRRAARARRYSERDESGRRDSASTEYSANHAGWGRCGAPLPNPYEGPVVVHGSGTRHPSRPGSAPRVRVNVGSCRASFGMSGTSWRPSSSP